MSSQPAPERPVRPEKPRRRVGLFATLGAVVVAAIVAAFAIPALISAQSEDEKTVRLGVNDIALEHWDVLVDLAKKEGITVKLVSFTDYNTPNPALDAGDIDLNKFQHVRYLANYNAAQGKNLVPIGATEIFPISFFSKKWTSVDEIPQGAEVTLSNNPANQVRPLLALYNAGLVAFTKDADWSVTIDDVDYSASRIGKITPIDPTQTAASLDSVDIAFVDDVYQGPAGLGEKEQLYTEDVNRPDLQQYVNIFAARNEDKDNATLKRVAELYHDPAVEAAVQKATGYSGVFKSDSQAELAKVLQEQEKLFAK